MPSAPPREPDPFPRSPREDAITSALVDNYTRFLRFLERRVGSREVAEDLLQDAFVRGIGRAASIRDGESVTAWFYRVLRNALTDHYRRQAVEARAHGRAAAIEDPFAEGPDAELHDEICGCIAGLVDTLKPEYARALRRVDLDEAPLREWAAEEGITLNNAAVRLHRSRAALKRRVTRACGTCARHACLDCRCRQGRSDQAVTDGS
jgi:RNA polymerase sigma-70 factor (ECF subfamily)